MKFFRDCRAANLRAPLQNQRLQTRLSEIKSCDETIVAATNDDNVAFLGHR
jgi:hypothetical protein